MIMMFKKYLYLHKDRKNLENENVLCWDCDQFFSFIQISITVCAINVQIKIENNYE